MTVLRSTRTWLRQDRAEAPVPLVCIPHAGAGASSFNRWLGLFPPDIAAVRVQLPGREDLSGDHLFHHRHRVAIAAAMTAALQ
ncbi:thioesterase domain-containing protein [Nocardia vinacea]|uniref:thioesterase domain-containing protein n=1 Tax=Nocardia vinacea TaxID=96468 RepID=UPI00030DD8B4|nr:thioesterase domain-containing protein [Nocardia vinacea]